MVGIGRKKSMEYRTIVARLAMEIPHHCCEYAEMYLFPPHMATQEPIQMDLGTLEIGEITYWYVDSGHGGPYIPVNLCPWCGQKLIVN